MPPMKLAVCRGCGEEKPCFDTFTGRIEAEGRPLDWVDDGCCLRCATNAAINATLDSYNRLTKEALPKTDSGQEVSA